ncbi:MAG: DUF5597 domain-containing protein [Acutalibacter sp.]|jgi:hypothetical protein
MKPIPVLRSQGNGPALVIDGNPTLLFAGELHNSSASSMEYLEREVWPHLRGLHLNTVVAPVSWECLEPRPEEFDFTLVDGLLAQARQEGVRLVLLWFGLWKNGMSTYVPGWMKADRQRYFLMEDRSGRSVEAISPLCQEAVLRDAHAFAALLAHLRDVDEERTVVMVQVENEMGLLGDVRDFSPQAEAAYAQPVPAPLEELCRVSGTWQEAFDDNGPERFMVYHYARAVEHIAGAGKAEYPLPMYVNAWLEQYPWTPGTYPSGGPIAKVMDQWKALAPSIDLLAPDIYLPDFEAVCREYTQQGNPLFIPEARPCMDSASNVFAAFGEHGALGFSPFAIESVGKGSPQPLAPDLAQLNIMAEAFDVYRSGEYLAESYALLESIEPLLLQYWQTPALRGFTRNGREEGTLLQFAGCDWLIRYTQTAGSPKGGGLLIQLGEHEFLLAGLNFQAVPQPKTGDPGFVEVISITEGAYKNGRWIPGRRLNGDEFRARLGSHPSLLQVRLGHRG